MSSKEQKSHHTPSYMFVPLTLADNLASAKEETGNTSKTSDSSEIMVRKTSPIQVKDVPARVQFADSVLEIGNQQKRKQKDIPSPLNNLHNISWLKKRPKVSTSLRTLYSRAESGLNDAEEEKENLGRKVVQEDGKLEENSNPDTLTAGRSNFFDNGNKTGATIHDKTLAAKATLQDSPFHNVATKLEEIAQCLVGLDSNRREIETSTAKKLTHEMREEVAKTVESVVQAQLKSHLKAVEERLALFEEAISKLLYRTGKLEAFTEEQDCDIRDADQEIAALRDTLKKMGEGQKSFPRSGSYTADVE